MWKHWYIRIDHYRNDIVNLQVSDEKYHMHSVQMHDPYSNFTVKVYTDVHQLAIL